MTPARQLLIEFVLEKSSAEPVSRRLQLYRALAAEMPDSGLEFKLLTSLADALEDVEARHDQLLLDLRKQGGLAGG
jgi:hypothetical protein